MKIYYIPILLFFIFGCRSSLKTDSQTRIPAENSMQKIGRSYQDSISCQPHNNENSVPLKLSALSGYMVGPTPAIYTKNPEAPTLRPFFSDGCSSSPDATPLTINSEGWIDCCIKHDTAYWLGGTREEKESADNNLERCMAEKGSPRIGKIYNLFVRQFGGPNSQHNYRWGYGWNFQREFAPISESESKLIFALYSEQKEKLGSTLIQSNFPLIRMCNSQDPVFFGFSSEEKLIYTILNSSLKNNALIEWAKWGYFNRAKREFEVKLSTCPTPIIFSFEKANNLNPKIESNCVH